MMMPTPSKMQVVILAGGIGTRLRPLTNDIPKPMVLIKGKPFLEYQLTLLKRQGFQKIVLCVGYLAEKIRNYFKDGAELGLDISYSVEKEPLGTGGALREARKLLEAEFVLLNGDSYINIPYGKVVEFYRNEKVSGVVVVYDNTLNLADNNILIRDNKFVVKYGGKTECNFIDAGVYVLNRDVVKKIKKGTNSSLVDGVLSHLIEKKALRAYETGRRYYDIGTFERLSVFESQVAKDF